MGKQDQQECRTVGCDQPGTVIAGDGAIYCFDCGGHVDGDDGSGFAEWVRRTFRRSRPAQPGDTDPLG